MTMYRIVPDACLQVVLDVEKIMESSNDNFPDATYSYGVVEGSMFAAIERSSDMDDSCLTVRDALTRLLDEEIQPTFKSIRDAINTKTDIMRNVIGYYVSGDAEMAYKADQEWVDDPYNRQSAVGVEYEGNSTLEDEGYTEDGQGVSTGGDEPDVKLDEGAYTDKPFSTGEQDHRNAGGDS